jgi:hypothetical protein
MRLIDANSALNDLCGYQCGCRIDECGLDKPCEKAKCIIRQPTIEPEVRHGNGCSYCKGRAYSKKPLTVITRTMKRVEVVFEYCPACGKKMNGGAGNV